VREGKWGIGEGKEFRGDEERGWESNEEGGEGGWLKLVTLRLCYQVLSPHSGRRKGGGVGDQNL